MAFLALLIGGVLAFGLLALFIVRILQVMSLVALALLCAISIAIGYVSLAVAGISLAALYELFGHEHVGWAAAGAVLIGLVVAGQMFLAIYNSIRSFPSRLRRWLGHAEARSSTDTHERTPS